MIDLRALSLVRTTHLHRSERVFAEVDGVLDTAPDAGGGSPGTGGVADLTEFSRVLVEIGLISEEELQSFASDSAEGVLGLVAPWSRPAS